MCIVGYMAASLIYPTGFPVVPPSPIRTTRNVSRPYPMSYGRKNLFRLQTTGTYMFSLLIVHVSDRAGNTKMVPTRPSACLASRKDNLECASQELHTQLQHTYQDGRRGRGRCLWRVEGIGFPSVSTGGFMEWEAYYLPLKNV